ncbi:MAG: calcium-binding protein [Paracoccaceae bacterium]
MELLFLLLAGGLAIGLGGLGGGGGDSSSDGGGDAAAGPPPTQEGGSGPDLLEGSPVIDDAIFGRGGSDTITGDVGNDFLDGGLGDDVIDGGIGDDTISGALGSDDIQGGPGDDSILGFGGADTISGGDDNDSIRGGDGADVISGDAGNDSLEGGLGADTLSGILGDPDDFPTTDADGADTIEGWGGADTLILGNGDQGFGEFATTSADNAGDTFVVGSWITGPPATVNDFNPAVDRIEYFNAVDETLAITEVNIAGDVTYQLTADGDVVLQLPVGMSGTVITLDNVIERTPT